MKNIRPYLIIISVFLFLLPIHKYPSHISHNCCEGKNIELEKVIKQKSGIDIRLKDYGWNWSEDDVSGTLEEGEISFHTTKWFMYLIHWGPIQLPEITVEYIKQRMIDMWGVDFEFTGNNGATQIQGHDAVWVEAYGTNRSFYTRFVVWNCPESGREFIGDLNYNLRLKTPIQDFEDQFYSIKTMDCHRIEHIENPRKGWVVYSSERYDLSFYHPLSWFIIDSPYYVPYTEYDGIRNHLTGSLLGLGSDQNIHITLRWFSESDTEPHSPVMGVDQKIIDNLINIIRKNTKIKDFQNGGRESYYIGERKIHRIWGICTFQQFDNVEDNDFYTDDGIYQAAQWRIGDKQAVAILFTRRYRFGVELSQPTRQIHDIFLKNFIQGIQ